MAMKLYVGGLIYAMGDQELEDMFKEFGTVSSAVIIKDKFSGQSKGFGFVEMDDLKEAQAAIKELDGKEVNGRKLMVNQARPQEERRPGGGGGNRGGSRGGGGGGGRDNYRRPY